LPFTVIDICAMAVVFRGEARHSLHQIVCR
jgi:hypothetical protein